MRPALPHDFVQMGVRILVPLAPGGCAWRTAGGESPVPSVLPPACQWSTAVFPQRDEGGGWADGTGGISEGRAQSVCGREEVVCERRQFRAGFGMRRLRHFTYIYNYTVIWYKGIRLKQMELHRLHALAFGAKEISPVLMRMRTTDYQWGDVHEYMRHISKPGWEIGLTLWHPARRTGKTEPKVQ